MYTLYPVNYACTTNMVFMFVRLLYYTKNFHYCLFCHEKVYIYFSALAILTYDNFVWEIVSISYLLKLVLSGKTLHELSKIFVEHAQHVARI